MNLPWDAEVAPLLAATRALLAPPHTLEPASDLATYDPRVAFERLLRAMTGADDSPPPSAAAGGALRRESARSPSAAAAQASHGYGVRSALDGQLEFGVRISDGSQPHEPPGARRLHERPSTAGATRAHALPSAGAPTSSAERQQPTAAGPQRRSSQAAVADGVARGPQLLASVSALPSLFDALLAERGSQQAGDDARPLPLSRPATADLCALAPTAKSAREPASVPTERTTQAREAQTHVATRPRPSSTGSHSATASNLERAQIRHASARPALPNDAIEPTASAEPSVVRELQALGSAAAAGAGSPPIAAADLRPDGAAWEESLIERLLERWEERLREHSIRQLGFLGGRV